jgi:hypothetical protein
VTNRECWEEVGGSDGGCSRIGTGRRGRSSVSLPSRWASRRRWMRELRQSKSVKIVASRVSTRKKWERGEKGRTRWWPHNDSLHIPRLGMFPSQRYASSPASRQGTLSRLDVGALETALLTPFGEEVERSLVAKRLRKELVSMGRSKEDRLGGKGRTKRGGGGGFSPGARTGGGGFVEPALPLFTTFFGPLRMGFVAAGGGGGAGVGFGPLPIGKVEEEGEKQGGKEELAEGLKRTSPVESAASERRSSSCEVWTRKRRLAGR